MKMSEVAQRLHRGCTGSDLRKHGLFTEVAQRLRNLNVNRPPPDDIQLDCHHWDFVPRLRGIVEYRPGYSSSTTYYRRRTPPRLRGRVDAAPTCQFACLVNIPRPGQHSRGPGRQHTPSGSISAVPSLPSLRPCRLMLNSRASRMNRMYFRCPRRRRCSVIQSTEPP